jgi:predicted aconitase
MIQTRMFLEAQDREILEGGKGQTLRKVLESVVLYGEAFGAQELVPLDGPVHLVTSFGIPLLKPVFDMMDEFIENGISAKFPFTVDPRPLDYENVKCNLLEKFVFKIMYGKQKDYESQLKRVGLKDENAFSCTCYMDEVGNIPKLGDRLAWAESSAVVYANSVLGARTNRNSGIVELFCGILGKAPLFGLLADEGRRAAWLIDVKTKSLPHPQVLGGAIGMRVVEEVPYVRGLDRFLGPELTSPVKDYFKEMGAAAASNGAVGLFHVENLTPEAKKSGAALLAQNANTCVVDDRELERVVASYPMMWKKPDARPKLGFIGCPHLSLHQLEHWTEWIQKTLEKEGRKKLKVRSVFCAAPDVVARFKKNPAAHRALLRTGAKLTSICPLMYMNNPICSKKTVVTNSNKLRTYTTARFYPDEELLALLAKGR